VLERRGEDVSVYPTSNDLFSSEDGITVVGFVPDAAADSPYFMLDEHAYARFALDPPPEIPPSLLRSYEGRYRFEDEDTATTWLQDGTLHLSFSWLGEGYSCVPLSETKFATDAGLVEFRRDQNGSVTLVWSGAVVAERLVDETGMTSFH
jgi:hypothetical protein